MLDVAANGCMSKPIRKLTSFGVIGERHSFDWILLNGCLRIRLTVRSENLNVL